MIPSDLIESLSEDELAFLLYLLNVVTPTLSKNKVPFTSKELRYFRKDILVAKLLTSGEMISHEGKPVFVSLMGKFGVKVEFKPEPEPLPEPPKPVELPVSASIEPLKEPEVPVTAPTGSVETPNV